jgi:hypothetical protein
MAAGLDPRLAGHEAAITQSPLRKHGLSTNSLSSDIA